MAIKKAISVLMLLFLVSCMDAGNNPVSTPTVFVITSTLPVIPVASANVLPTDTLAAVNQIPPVQPISGVTTTQLNVRSEPSTASQNLGMIPAFSQVQVIGQESSGTWFQILYSQSPYGKGWVTGAYVQVNDKMQIPFVEEGTTHGYAGSGRVIQPINVRNGPGTEFDSLGTLAVNDIVKLIGRNDSGSWLQIEYAASPDGKGWITTTYLDASGFENLPIVSDAGVLVGTATPAGLAPKPIPTVVTASDDGDSESSPALNIIFSPSASRSFIYSSDLSAPQGDAEDWLGFTPYTNFVSLKLQCDGSAQAQLSLLQNGSSITTLTCAGDQVVRVESGTNYLLRISIMPSAGGLVSLRFEVEVASVAN